MDYMEKIAKISDMAETLSLQHTELRKKLKKYHSSLGYKGYNMLEELEKIGISHIKYDIETCLNNTIRDEILLGNGIPDTISIPCDNVYLYNENGEPITEYTIKNMENNEYSTITTRYYYGEYDEKYIKYIANLEKIENNNIIYSIKNIETYKNY